MCVKRSFTDVVDEWETLTGQDFVVKVQRLAGPADEMEVDMFYSTFDSLAPRVQWDLLIEMCADLQFAYATLTHDDGTNYDMKHVCQKIVDLQGKIQHLQQEVFQSNAFIETQ
jgi:hypothetical protein